MLCRCFFFFKQKTAYEMRISDWSSDVCSSDLLFRPRGLAQHVEAVAVPGRTIARAPRQRLFDRPAEHIMAAKERHRPLDRMSNYGFAQPLAGLADRCPQPVARIIEMHALPGQQWALGGSVDEQRFRCPRRTPPVGAPALASEPVV